jgi:hypothetical protein
MPNRQREHIKIETSMENCTKPMQQYGTKRSVEKNS